MVAHRRWGKDDVALHFTACQAMQRVGNYWHMLPQYGQARKVIWNAVDPKTQQRRIDEAFPEIIRAPNGKHEQEMAIHFRNGSIWQLVGSDNYNSIIGSPPVGIVFSEWAVANPASWAYLSPILEENSGWALFIYTARPTPHAKETYRTAQTMPGWYSQLITAKDSPVFTPSQLKEIRQTLISMYGDDFGDAMFQQEYFCSFTGAILGAYFGKQIKQARDELRITNVPYIPSVEVDTFWDLGIDDSMSIWFMQPVGKAYHFIDYYEGTGYGLPHYAKILKEKPYIYGNHWMPHDANNREMTNSEIAKSPREVAEDLGIRPIQIVQRARNMETIIEVHIPAVRNILSQCWFDEVKCSKGISALENFKSEYNEEKNVLSNAPVHDWASHAASAFRTFAVGYDSTYFGSKLLKSFGRPLGDNHRGFGWMM